VIFLYIVLILTQQTSVPQSQTGWGQLYCSFHVIQINHNLFNINKNKIFKHSKMLIDVLITYRVAVLCALGSPHIARSI
jgi:hypothetical protein